MGASALMSHMPQTLAIIALDLVSVIHPCSELDYFRQCHCFGFTLPLGSLAAGTSTLILLSLTLIGFLLLGFWCALHPFYS